MFHVEVGEEVIIDLIGKRFDRLVVIKYIRSDKWRNKFWLCKCDCGEETTVYGGNLKNSHAKSCGCLSIEKLKDRSITHGHYKNGKMSQTYQSWNSMIQRCTNPNNISYPDYGGRGIKVCKRWKNSFENFLADMGEAPEGYQTDRINNNGNYCKSNCRWATPKENSRNRRNNRMVTHKGKTQCLSIWAEEFDIYYGTLKWRLNNGWPTERALTTPVKKRGE